MTEYIDKIIYINLEHRNDRREQIEHELNNMNLSYERFNAIKINDHPGYVGCGYSHLNVLKIARERGYKNILIFEDDFEFLVSKEKFKEQLNLLFSSEIEFDICMLSYNLIKGEVYEKNPFLTKVLDAQTTSGYIVNHTIYDKLINLYEWAIPLLNSTREHWIYSIDQIWKKYQPTTNWYCFTERCGKQRPSYSDNGEFNEPIWSDNGC
jgi:hypothetical protein